MIHSSIGMTRRCLYTTLDNGPGSDVASPTTPDSRRAPNAAQNFPFVIEWQLLYWVMPLQRVGWLESFSLCIKWRAL